MTIDPSFESSFISDVSRSFGVPRPLCFSSCPDCQSVLNSPVLGSLFPLCPLLGLWDVWTGSSTRKSSEYRNSSVLNPRSCAVLSPRDPLWGPKVYLGGLPMWSSSSNPLPSKLTANDWLRVGDQWVRDWLDSTRQGWDPYTVYCLPLKDFLLS